MGNLTKSQHTGAKQWDENRNQGRGIFAAPPSAVADRPNSATAGSDKMAMIRDEQKAIDQAVAAEEAKRKAAQEAAVPVYGCKTRDEWLCEWLGHEVAVALDELWSLLGDAPQPAEYRYDYYGHGVLENLQKKRAPKPQSLQSPSEVLVDAAIAKQKAAKGTSRLDELKDGIRDGVPNYDERKDEQGRVQLFDDIYLWRTTVAIVVKHPDNANSVVVAVPGRDGKPELCKDITDELATFLMRIRDGQKKVQHKALASVNEVEAKPAPVAAKPYTPPPARPSRARRPG